MGKTSDDEAMEVLEQGICRCGGAYLVTQTRGEDRSRVRHREPICEYFAKLPAPLFLKGLAEWRKRQKKETPTPPPPNPFLRKPKLPDDGA